MGDSPKKDEKRDLRLQRGGKKVEREVRGGIAIVEFIGKWEGDY